MWHDAALSLTILGFTPINLLMLKDQRTRMSRLVSGAFTLLLAAQVVILASASWWASMAPTTINMVIFALIWLWRAPLPGPGRANAGRDAHAQNPSP